MRLVTDVASDSGQTFAGLQLADRYHLTDVLAHGALCEVYRGDDLVLRRPVAAKAIPAALAATYRAALHATAALTHPATVALYDAIDHDEWLFLIQEYVPAWPLADYLRTEMPAERAVALMGQLARAIGYAHTQGVVHGDLTPTAVLVDRQAIVRINNFALPADAAYFTTLRRQLAASTWQLAPTVGPATQPADADDAASRPALSAAAPRAVSAPAALEPSGAEPSGAEPSGAEPLGAESSGGAAGDVWAIGALLWQLVSEPSAATEGGRQFRASVPNVVRKLVGECLVAPEAERIATAEALAERLDAVAAELARFHPTATPLTPPALRAARAAVADMGLWADEEPVFAAPARARQRIPPPESSIFNAPTDPVLHDVMATQPARHFGDTPGAPLFPLPARVRDVEVGAEAPPELPPTAASAPVPEWQVRARWEDAEPPVARGRLGLPTVLALGVILFVIFFIIGYVAPSLFAR
jgi:serine/threonine protein kinase